MILFVFVLFVWLLQDFPRVICSFSFVLAMQAVGTGNDASVAKAYAAEDLDLFDFALTDAEMAAIQDA